MNKEVKKQAYSISSENAVFWDLSNSDVVSNTTPPSNKNYLNKHLHPEKFPPHFDEKSRWINTDSPVLRTDKDFTIIAWVNVNLFYNSTSNVAFLDGINAMTAVSQESDLVSAFHLGLRSKNDGSVKTPPRWCFTLSPERGDLDPFGCHNVYGRKDLESSDDKKFSFLAGVCNYQSWSTHLYLPQLNDSTSNSLPKVWTPWHADKRTVIGRGKWEGENVDIWNGSIRAVGCYQSALNERDIFDIYHETLHLLNEN